MQPDNYKPKTTIIQANPDLVIDGRPVVAWVIEDGQIVEAITYNPLKEVRITVQRGAEE